MGVDEGIAEALLIGQETKRLAGIHKRVEEGMRVELEIPLGCGRVQVDAGEFKFAFEGPPGLFTKVIRVSFTEQYV